MAGADHLSAMGAVTVRLTEELQALVDDEVRNGVHPSAEAYIQSLLMEEHASRSAELLVLLDAGLASGVAEGEGLEAFDRAIARAKEKARSRAV
jgi:Arc/MetJ-type ribon-helix-helix transcriptional regulator